MVDKNFMTITIIMPNYNGVHLLEKNLPHVVAAAKHYTKGEIDIVISDDHSIDNSLAFLESFSKSEKTISIYITSNKGLQGFSCNVNNAVRHAKGDILLLLNTDVIPERDFIAPLVEGFSDEKVFAIGCLDETTDDEGKPRKYGRSFGSWKRGFVVHESADAEASDKTFWVSCGSGAFRRDLWEKLHGLDELYNPFYWEDIDLSYRAVKSGYTIRFEKKSVVTHLHEVGAIKKNFSSNKVTTTAYRNQIIFIWKNITDSDLILKNILWLPYYVVKTLLSGDTNFVAGLFAAILLLPKIRKSKLTAMHTFVLSDKVVLNKQKI